MDDFTAAAAAAGVNNLCNLGDDLVMNILSRLPPKPLVVCKCVSKSWRRLISTLIHSPTRPRPMTGLFVGLFDLRNGLEAIEYFYRRDCEIDEEIDVDSSLSFLPCHPDTRLVDCREGLLLCSSKNIGEQEKYFVCNPITGQWVSLPPPPERSSSSGRVDVNDALVLDEGSDLCYSHFKVVRFVTLYGENPESAIDAEVGSSEEEDEESLDDLYVDVYSSRTGKWEESKAFMKGISFVLLDRPSVYVDGVLFLSSSPFHFVMYDCKEEYCEELDLPVDLDLFMWFNLNCLGKSGGCLHHAYHNGSEMKVWMIEDGDTREWVLKHNINLADIDFPDPSAEDDYVRKEPLEILAFHPDSDAIFIRKKGDFFCYNFNTKAVERVVCYHRSSTIDMLFRTYPFSDCLCPLVDAQQRT